MTAISHLQTKHQKGKYSVCRLKKTMRILRHTSYDKKIYMTTPLWLGKLLHDQGYRSQRLNFHVRLSTNQEKRKDFRHCQVVTWAQKLKQQQKVTSFCNYWFISRQHSIMHHIGYHHTIYMLRTTEMRIPNAFASGFVFEKLINAFPPCIYGMVWCDLCHDARSSVASWRSGWLKSKQQTNLITKQSLNNRI